MVVIRQLGEFYAAVWLLIGRLKKEGHLSKAQKLETAMLAGSTGSEILGEIMLVLKTMRGRYSPELNKEIDGCYKFALRYRRILRLDNPR